MSSATTILPISVVIPTRNRAQVLARTLDSLAVQSHQPSQVLVVDASSTTSTEDMLSVRDHVQGQSIIYLKADRPGAASQRNEGVVKSKEEFVLFMDDDIVMEPDCILNLWRGISSGGKVGGVSAMITNQHYTTPGRVSLAMYRMLSGQRADSYAGKIIGPAWNLLPEDVAGRAEFARCEWLNTTCTLYRKSALPQPPFDSIFHGYSLMEDVALSVNVSRQWDILNANSARIFHDSQPGEHKDDLARLSEMEVVNRHYIMTSVLGRKGVTNNLKLLFFELFQLASGLAGHKSVGKLVSDMRGKFKGLIKVMS